MPTKLTSEAKTEIHEEALKRFEDSASWEDEDRDEGREDLLFKRGGIHQWPGHIVSERVKKSRPILTINRLPTFTDQIIGDNRSNKVSIKIRPTGRQGSEEIAQIREGLCRHIQTQSDADSIYQWGLQCAVDCGRGAWRVIVEDSEDDPFEKEICLERIRNAFTVYNDPRAKKWNLSDERYKFVSEWISREKYKEDYPDFEPMSIAVSGTGDSPSEWIRGDDVRIAEYWRKVQIDKTYHKMSNGDVVDDDDMEDYLAEAKAKKQPFSFDEQGNLLEGTEQTMMSALPSSVINPVPTIVNTKKVKRDKVEMYIIDGAEILEGPHEHPGKYIPIVIVWGKEIDIDGKNYHRGIIRDAKDPQRMLNYHGTEEIERVALAKKAPTRLTPKQIKGHQAAWNSDDPQKYLLYNPDPAAPPPIDTPPPQLSTGNVQAYGQRVDELKAVTGIFDASLGARSNETSGIAIARREQAANVANFEYHDNLVRSVKYTGDIINDLIPHVYSDERTIVILGEDDSQQTVTINMEQPNVVTGETSILNDITQGKYNCVVTVGPSFQTERIETSRNLIDLAQAIPPLGTLGADLIVSNLDFKGADELAERYRKTLPPQVVQDENAPQQPPGGPGHGQPQPDPEMITAQMEAQANMQIKKLEAQKKEIDLKRAVVDLQKTIAELRGSMQKISAETAERTIDKLMKGFGVEEGRQLQ